MGWQLKDEFLDLAQARHVVVYVNTDTKAEHHIVHDFRLDACPHCGRPNVGADNSLVDIETIKAETLNALQDHHRALMNYRAKHPNVRLGAK